MDRIILDEIIKDKVMNLLNKIKLIEFKYNCTLGEYARISNYSKIRQDSNFKRYKSEIEEILRPYTKDLVVKISEIGLLEILEAVDKLGDSVIYQSKLTLISNLDLPYAWVMGKTCSKKVSQQILEQYNYLLEEEV